MPTVRGTKTNDIKLFIARLQAADLTVERMLEEGDRLFMKSLCHGELCESGMVGFPRTSCEDFKIVPW